MDYQEFIQNKVFKTSDIGFHVPQENLNPKLFDFQKMVVEWAIKKGNAALWEDCGLGKTPQQLEWANQVHQKTNKPILILAPLAVAQQTKRQGDLFDIPVNICKSHKDIINGINIANYERMHKFEFSAFSGLVLDESSILKNYMGKTKRALVDEALKIPYKLSCTATPAPNDHMELLNQAEFLGVMKSSMALAVWFINKTNELGGYRLKKHAESSFWEWVTNWAVYLSSPSDLGFSNEGFVLPHLDVVEHEIPISDIDLSFDNGSFLRDIHLNATSYNREKRHTLKHRCKKTAEIIQNNPGKQFVIWTELNDEGKELRNKIPGSIEIKGSDSPDKKEEAAMAFIDGQIDILISKPSIFGYGLNLQHCHNTIFCGLSFSYENYYQAVRRFWRFKQEKPVHVHIVYGSSERSIVQIVRKKEESHKTLQTSMNRHMKEKQAVNFSSTNFKSDYARNQQMILPAWLKGEIS